MSSVIVTPLEPGDAITITDPNSTMSSWDGATANVTAENVRLEGLDARNFGVHSVVESVAGSRAGEWSGPSGVTRSAFGTTTPIAVSTRPVQVSTFVFNSSADPELVIYVSAEIDSTSGLDIQFQLGYSLTGVSGQWTAIPVTHRSLGLGPAYAQNGSFGIFHRFTTTGIDTTTLYIGLFAWEGGGSMFKVQNVTMYGKRYLV